MKFQGSKTLFLFFGLALLLWIFPGLDDLERWTLDERFRWRAPRSVPDDIVIVNIDRSQPWTREQPPLCLESLVRTFHWGHERSIRLLCHAGYDLFQEPRFLPSEAYRGGSFQAQGYNFQGDSPRSQLRYSLYGRH